MLYDSTDVRDLKKSNSQRQRAEWWLPGTGGGVERVGEMLVRGHRIPVRQEEAVQDISFITW